VAVLVDCLTDNKNRTVGEVRHAFTKHGGNLGTSGSVAYLFDKKGQMIFGDDINEDDLMEAALEAGAEDVVNHDDGSFEVLTAPDEFIAVKETIVAAGFKPENAEVAMLPSTQAELDADEGAKVLRLIERLEDLDDVQNVYTNADIPDEAYDQL
jgi:YebC/PmpR family DNA-binding regulatory protein